MLNLTDAFRALVAAESEADRRAPVKGGRLSFFDPAHLATFLTIAGAVYSMVAKLLPPDKAIEIGAALSLVFLLYSFVLKLHHQAVTPIRGIPAVQPALDALLPLLEKKYPQLVDMDGAIKAAIAAANAPPPAIIAIVPDAPPAIASDTAKG